MVYIMLYEEKYFVGNEKKRLLIGFPGKIKSIDHQLSGNTILTLLNKHKNRIVEKKAIFKKIEYIHHDLEEKLHLGDAVFIYGINSRKQDIIFPVFFLKVKIDEKLQIISLPENEIQYKVVLEQQDRAVQKGLDEF
mgnify:CR=1 FL=1